MQYIWQEDNETTWVRLVTPHAGAGRGMLFYPEIGDEVLIVFEEGDPERPYAVGSAWNGVHQPPATGFHSPGETNGSEFARNNIKRLVTKSGHRITVVDTPGRETISIATPQSNRLMLTESHKDTGGRPAIVLETQGDMIFAAPSGRIHHQAMFRSADVGGQSAVPKLMNAIYNQAVPQAASSSSKGKTTIIHHKDGTVEKKHGSSAFRNNNPGNLRDTPFSRRHGAIGVDPAPPPGGHGPFAVFDTPEDGEAALTALIKSPDVQGRSIGAEMAKYAVKGDGKNDPVGYAKDIATKIGGDVKPETQISDLTNEQTDRLIHTIKVNEGYYDRTGTSEILH